MKKSVLQLVKIGNELLYRPFDDQSQEVARGYHLNQLLEADIKGTSKERSLKQLKTYWGGCNVVADNLENMTPEEVDFEVKVRLKHIKQFRIVNGVTIVEVDSISYARLPHLTACRYFDRAFPVLAGMIGVTVDELMAAIAERGK